MLTNKSTFEIFYSTHTLIGRTTGEAELQICGTFLPTQYFKQYENLFRSLEHAANQILLTHADQLEKQIASLNFYATTDTNPENKLTIKDLQIIEGWITFQIIE